MKKIIYTLTLPLFLFCLLPLAQAQESTMSKEMTEVIEKAVEKTVNERIAAIKADLIKEMATQAQNYCIAQIDAYYPDSQTASVITKRRVIDGKVINESWVGGEIPIFFPIGSNTSIKKVISVLFFSPLSTKMIIMSLSLVAPIKALSMSLQSRASLKRRPRSAAPRRRP